MTSNEMGYFTPIMSRIFNIFFVRRLGVVLNLVFIVSVVTASITECPVQNTSGCYCWTKYLSDNHMYCEFLGTLSKLPKFSYSNETFDTFTIRYNSSLQTIQSNAFLGLKIRVLNLQKLETAVVYDGAFNGLQNDLEELHMDDNKISTIGPNVLSGLWNLRYLGLHNNLLRSVPTANGSEGLKSIEYIHLFNNNITRLDASSFLGMTSLRGVSLANNRIDSLPEGLLSSLLDLTQLDISKNRLMRLDSPFAFLHKLLHLRLDNNLIHTLHKDVFSNLSVLTHLYVHNNRLHGLSKDLFSNNADLEHLDLSSNFITAIHVETFKNLTRLKTLYLQNNMIDTLPSGVFDALVSLQRLHLTKNRLHNINIFSAPLYSLWDLQLSENNVARLQNELFANLHNLLILDLSNNSLILTKYGFMGLSKLQSLSLSWNPVKTVPAFVFSPLIALERLFLSNCDIDTFEETCFHGLANLTFLDLTHNNIVTFPTAKPIFNDTQDLHTLKLSNNLMKNLHKAFLYGLKGLSFLYMDYNKLTAVAPESFVYLEKLNKLHIRHNDISILNPLSFARLHSLQELDLSYNKLQRVYRGSFEFFNSLKTLNLAHNLLRRVSWSELSDIYNIEELDFSHNNLQTMNDDQLINKHKLRQVMLTGNKFDCRGCRMGRIRMLNTTVVANVDKLECYTPAKRKGDLLACYDLGYCGVYYQIESTETMKKFCSVKVWRNATINQIPSTRESAGFPSVTTTASHSSSSSEAATFTKAISTGSSSVELSSKTATSVLPASKGSEDTTLSTTLEDPWISADATTKKDAEGSTESQFATTESGTSTGEITPESAVSHGSDPSPVPGRMTTVSFTSLTSQEVDNSTDVPASGRATIEITSRPEAITNREPSTTASIFLPVTSGDVGASSLMTDSPKQLTSEISVSSEITESTLDITSEEPIKMGVHGARKTTDFISYMTENIALTSRNNLPSTASTVLAAAEVSVGGSDQSNTLSSVLPNEIGSTTKELTVKETSQLYTKSTTEGPDVADSRHTIGMGSTMEVTHQNMKQMGSTTTSSMDEEGTSTDRSVTTYSADSDAQEAVTEVEETQELAETTTEGMLTTSVVDLDTLTDESFVVETTAEDVDMVITSTKKEDQEKQNISVTENPPARRDLSSSSSPASTESPTRGDEVPDRHVSTISVTENPSVRQDVTSPNRIASTESPARGNKIPDRYVSSIKPKVDIQTTEEPDAGMSSTRFDPSRPGSTREEVSGSTKEAVGSYATNEGENRDRLSTVRPTVIENMSSQTPDLPDRLETLTAAIMKVSTTTVASAYTSRENENGGHHSVMSSVKIQSTLEASSVTSSSVPESSSKDVQGSTTGNRGQKPIPRLVTFVPLQGAPGVAPGVAPGIALPAGLQVQGIRNDLVNPGSVPVNSLPESREEGSSVTLPVTEKTVTPDPIDTTEYLVTPMSTSDSFQSDVTVEDDKHFISFQKSTIDISTISSGASRNADISLVSGKASTTPSETTDSPKIVSRSEKMSMPSKLSTIPSMSSSREYSVHSDVPSHQEISTESVPNHYSMTTDEQNIDISMGTPHTEEPQNMPSTERFLVSFGDSDKGSLQSSTDFKRDVSSSSAVLLETSTIAGVTHSHPESTLSSDITNNDAMSSQSTMLMSISENISDKQIPNSNNPSSDFSQSPRTSMSVDSSTDTYFTKESVGISMATGRKQQDVNDTTVTSSIISSETVPETKLSHVNSFVTDNMKDVTENAKPPNTSFGSGTTESNDRTSAESLSTAIPSLDNTNKELNPEGLQSSTTTENLFREGDILTTLDTKDADGDFLNVETTEENIYSDAFIYGQSSELSHGANVDID